MARINPFCFLTTVLTLCRAWENLNIFQLYGSLDRPYLPNATNHKVLDIDPSISSYHHCSNVMDNQSYIRCQLINICNYQGRFYYFLPTEPQSNRLGAVGLGSQGESISAMDAQSDGKSLPKFDVDSRAFFQFEAATESNGLHAFAQRNEITDVMWHHRPAYFHNKHACTNAGHCITENLLPIVVNMFTWEMQMLSNVNVLDNDILLLEDTPESCGCATNAHACGDEGTAPSTLDLCNRFVRNILGTASINPVQYLSNLDTVKSLDLNTMDCWDKAYAGTGSILPYTDKKGQMQQMGPFYTLMRDLVHHRFQQYPSMSERKRRIFCQSSDAIRLNVTMYNKNGHRKIENMLEVQSWTESHSFQPLGFKKSKMTFCDNVEKSSVLGDRKVQFSVTMVSWETMTMEEQIRQLAATDILISSPGGGSINSVFLPHTSVLITGALCSGGWRVANWIYQGPDGKDRKRAVCLGYDTTGIFQHMVRSCYINMMQIFIRWYHPHTLALAICVLNIYDIQPYLMLSVHL